MWITYRKKVENRDEARFGEEHWTLVDHLPSENSDDGSAQVVPEHKNLGSWFTISNYMSKIMTWVKPVKQWVSDIDFHCHCGRKIKERGNFLKDSPAPLWMGVEILDWDGNSLLKLGFQGYYLKLSLGRKRNLKYIPLDQGSLPTAHDEEEAVLLMLHYIYTGEVKGLKTHARELLELAEDFGFQGLKTKAENALISSLNPENVVDFLVVGYLQKATVLQVKVIEFITQNPEVKHSPSFIALQVNNSELMTRLGF